MLAQVESVDSYITSWWPFIFSLVASIIAGIRYENFRENLVLLMTISGFIWAVRNALATIG